MEEEKAVCEKFMKQHKFNVVKTPRSRRLRKRSPLANKNSENYFETNDAFTLTQGYFMSPTRTRMEADNIYKSNIELQKLKKLERKERNQIKPKKSVIDEYITKRAEDANIQGHLPPDYSSDQKVSKKFKPQAKPQAKPQPKPQTKPQDSPQSKPQDSPQSKSQSEAKPPSASSSASNPPPAAQSSASSNPSSKSKPSFASKPLKPAPKPAPREVLLESPPASTPKEPEADSTPSKHEEIEPIHEK